MPVMPLPAAERHSFSLVLKVGENSVRKYEAGAARGHRSRAAAVAMRTSTATGGQEGGAGGGGGGGGGVGHAKVGFYREGRENKCLSK